MRADLHIHSIHSDGSKTLEEIIKLAEIRNVDLIAITDHDNIDIINDVKDKNVIIGTEFSTMHNGENIHLLGYYKNNKPNKNIIKFLDDLEKNREIRAKEMLKRLDEIFNIKLDYEELKNIAGSGSIGRPHIAKLINKKYKIGIETSFKKYLGNNSPCFIPSSNQELKNVIDFLHNNDAIAILAHPIYYKKTSIEEFINLGIDGIECFYPEHKKKFTKKLVKICELNNLIITGGSDFHNINNDKNSHGEIGDSFIEDEHIEKFLSKIGEEI